MNWFSVRVELLHNPHAPTWEDYVGLHARMASAGFRTVVTTDLKQNLSLPRAEYFASKPLAIDAARQEALSAISRGLRPGLSFRLFIAEVIRWQGHNLAPA
jgi:hypothetical protein